MNHKGTSRGSRSMKGEERPNTGEDPKKPNFHVGLMTDPRANISSQDQRIGELNAIVRELRTSLNEAIERARTAEAECAEACENIPLPYLSLDARWRVTEANHAAHALWDRDGQNLLGTNYWALLGYRAPPPPPEYRKYTKAFEEGKIADFEGFAPGLKKWFKVHAVPTGQRLHLWLQDMTVQKTQMEAQVRMWRYQKSLADNAPDIFMRFDKAFLCIFASRAIESILGIEPLRVIGRGQRAMGLPEGLAGAIKEGLQTVFDTGEPMRQGLWVEVQGARKYLSLRMIGEPGIHAEVDTVLVIIQDATERKATEEKQEKLETQLREVQKLEAVGTLSGGIAHDFNNLLAVVLGNAELALDDTPEGSPVAQNLKNLLGAALRGRDLVKQILAFSRKSAQNRQALSVAPLIKETAKLLRSTIPATVDIGIEVRAGHDSTFADPVQIQQVLVNLATNAAQAMPEGGTMTVSLDNVVFGSSSHLPEPGMNPGEYLALAVRDSGRGMDAPTREHIFEPFFTTRASQGGTGLGLSVVYGIAKTHEGAVTVESAPGKGSIFTVFLPVSDKEAAGVQPSSGERVRGRGRILVVDDEYLVAQATGDALSSLGYEVRTETEPIQALKAFVEKGSFDLVITDQAMPGMSGLNLAKRLLKNRPGIPIVLCTGYSAAVNEKTAKAAGIRELLMKPYTRTELSRIVDRVLERRTERA